MRSDATAQAAALPLLSSCAPALCQALTCSLSPPSYGIGKWRLIQKDAELGSVLRQRSNVDLKVRGRRESSRGCGGCSPRRTQDKWRNMHPNDQAGDVQAKYAVDRSQAQFVPPERATKPKGSKAARAAAAEPPVDVGAPGAQAAARQIETLVFEAVRTLKHAATMDGIAVAIEDQYDVPAKFRDQLKEHLRSLVASGKLTKNKNAFAVPTVARGASAGPTSFEDLKHVGYRTPRLPGGTKVPEFLVNGKRLTAEEIAEDAERAVREAEDAAAEAEAAAREAERAEAEALRSQGALGLAR